MFIKNIFERLKKLFKKDKEPKIVKAKVIKLRKADIQENLVRIKMTMDQTPINTPEYDALAKEMGYQLDLLKKFKDANQVISLKDAMVVIGGTAGLIFFVALSREFPSALKTASLIMKFIPFKG